MTKFDILAQTSENTVISEYTPEPRQADFYQSEAELEKEFIRRLGEQGYDYLPIHTEEDLLQNLREKLETLNDYQFSNDEWERFLTTVIANPQESIKEKTRKIQEDTIQVLKRDNGEHKNIRLMDRDHIHKNSLQVINQYTMGKSKGANRNNRYDVTILVNGLPLVHVELKRRGVALREAFNQIDRYQRDSFWAGSGLFDYVQIFVISNGTHTKYYSNTTRRHAVENTSSKRGKSEKGNRFAFTSFWADARNKVIPDLVDFTKTFFALHTLLAVLIKYSIFTAEDHLIVMRPYQITATERIIQRIVLSHHNKHYGTRESGGFIWHTTGAGKTLTSFKTAQIASRLNFIDKVLFVVDRKDLDYQTMKEYDRFEKGAANSNTSTRELEKQLSDNDERIIITTIQKLSKFIAHNKKQNKAHDIYQKEVVIIFDECHRSQFGDMHRSILASFQKYYLFGFTGTPILRDNANPTAKAYATTEQLFGKKLHTYTIVDAIHDKNVLPFRIDYVKTIGKKQEEIEDEQIPDIDRQAVFEDPERIVKVAQYVLDHFDQKTYRNEKNYKLSTLTNIKEIARGVRGAVIEQKQERRLSGFNSIFAVGSVHMAKLYYESFRSLMDMENNLQKRLKIAVIYSYAPNEEEGGLLGEENPEDTSNLDKTARDFLESAIKDYNALFQTSYDTSSEKFQGYYKDVSLRMKNKELDMLIVVNMFLTGFDATTLNTLWVDKNLRMHGLLQAFSRTNRILNNVKNFGNIVCFRNLEKEVERTLALFGNENAPSIVLLKSFDDYYNGYEDDNGKPVPGYTQILEELKEKFPLEMPQILGEQNQKDFIKLFGAFLRLRNILVSFDEFTEKELISERDLQDYLGKYQDLRDEWKEKIEKDRKSDITEDIVFEVELVAQIDVDIDYILRLVQQYRESQGQAKEEMRISIQKAINASPDLRSKKELIEIFMAQVTPKEDITHTWNNFVKEQREKELNDLIKTEQLKPEEARQYFDMIFRDGEVKTVGESLDKILPPMSRFGSSNRTEKKENVIAKIKTFFEKYSGIGTSPHFSGDHLSHEEEAIKS